MATTASLRLPWRTVIRATTNPSISSAHILRVLPSAEPPTPYCMRRHTSTTVDPPASSEPASTSITISDVEIDTELDVRLPRSVQAVYLRPLRRQAEYGVPSCDLQMRSYSVRNLEFFADFALRAAYYLGLPAYGPIPLPRITERWTVPRANFIYKKSQENFERKTLRRLIQIKDGHPETIEIWLAFLKKHSYYGIGMKANVWEYNKIGVGKTMDVNMEEMKTVMDPKWAYFGVSTTPGTTEKVMEILNRESFQAASGGSAPMVIDHLPPKVEGS